MKKLAIVLLLVAACHRQQNADGTPKGTDAGGATTPRAAIDAFMASVKTQDVQAMALVWGTSEGPAIAIMKNKTSREQAEIIMMCYLKHDSYSLMNEAPTVGGRSFDAELKFRDLTRRTNFVVTQGPSDRWFVLSVDIRPLSDLCAQK